MQPVIEKTITVEEIIRDTTVLIKPDTATVKALFECDSLNQVVLKELDVVKGRKVAPEVKFKDRWFEVTLPVDSESVYLSWREKHKTETVTVTITKIEKVKIKPPWYIKVLSWIGTTSLGALLIFLLLKRIR